MKKTKLETNTNFLSIISINLYDGIFDPYNFFEDAIKEFKSLQNDGNNLTEKFTLTSAIIEANERLRFFQSNDYKESYMFNKQLVII